MDSHEAIRRAVGENAVEIAKAIGRSANLVYRWTLPTTDFSDSGAYSDLDRLTSLIEKSLSLGTSPVDAFAPIYHLAHKFGGVFLPPVPKTVRTREVAQQLCKVVKEAGDAFSVAAKALEDDKLSPNERKEILREAYEAMAEFATFARMIEGPRKGSEG